MGVLSDRIQHFIDSITNATTAMDSDVVEGKAYWKAGQTKVGTLPAINEDSYNINIAPNKEDVRVIFLQKAYTLPTDTITIPRSVLEEVLKKLEEISYTDSKDDVFYLPETDEDFYNAVLLENYYDREVELPNITLCTDDFLINSTATNHIVVSQEWMDKYPEKAEYFTAIPETTNYICSVDGNLVPFYDAIPDWALISEDGGTTWIINSDAVKWTDKENNIVGLVALKGYDGDEYDKVPAAGRIYFPGGIKVIIDETRDETTIGDFTFQNTSIVRYGPNGVTVNNQLKPLDASGALYGWPIIGMGDIINTENEELDQFAITGAVPIVKTLNAYQESDESCRHVIVTNEPFIFDFKYSTLVLVDDGGLHTSGGDTGVSNPSEPEPTEPEGETETEVVS